MREKHNNPNEEHLEQIVMHIAKIAAQDFSARLSQDLGDESLNAIALGLNMLSEELENTIVSKEKYLEQTRQLNQLIQSAPGYFYKLDIKDNFSVKYMAPSISALGYDSDGLIKNSGFWNANVHPDDKHLLIDNRNKIKSKESFKHTIEYRFKKSNGEYIWLRDRVSVNSDAEENPSTLIGFLISIQDEIVVKEQYENLYRAITHSAIVTMTDAAGKIIFVNDKFTQISGYSDVEIIGQDHRILNSGFHSKEFFIDLWGTIRSGNTWRGVIRNKRKNGSYYWVKTLIEPNKNRVGEVIGYTSVRFDITEELETQKKLVHATKIAAIGDLAAGIGHEINNPLMIAIGGFDKIFKSVKQNHEFAALSEEFEIVKESLLRIANITGTLRVYSRSEDGQTIAFDVNKEVEGIIRLVRNSYKILGITLEVHLCSDALMIEGNIGKFQQMLMNLVANAKDAVENASQKQIHISTEKNNDHVLIKISDTGMGIPDDVKPKIFEAYFTTKAAGKGTGIGLSLTQSIATEMQGKIRFDSQSGQGTTFTLEFPLVSENKTEHGHKEKMSSNTDLEKIQGIALIVDDEKGIRRVLREELEDIGLTVDEAEDGVAALEKVKNKKYDYIFTDMQMPNMNGMEFIRNLLVTENSQANIFITTGGLSSRQSDEERAWLDSVTRGFIHKPFNGEKILKILKRIK